MEEIEIVYQDREMLVLNKPSGWTTTLENQKPKNQKYVEDWLRVRYPNGLPREGIVHRLDKGTSGLLVVAKNEEMWLKLKDEFRNRRVKKKYLALAGGDLPVRGEIQVPVGRLKGRGRFGVLAEGKEAKTSFEVIAKYNFGGRILSLVELWPETGRTHQIRVHLKYMGWPIVGDGKYGGPKVLGLDRPFLHAAKIMILGKKFTVSLPADLERILKNNNEKVV